MRILLIEYLGVIARQIHENFLFGVLFENLLLFSFCSKTKVNDDVLKVTKADFDTRCKAYLANIFDDCPGIFMSSSKDAAEIVYGLMIGLRSAVYFDSDIDLEDAHRLFLGSTLRMGGLD